jgi:protein involved in ribonucleotide reduction
VVKNWGKKFCRTWKLHPEVWTWPLLRQLRLRGIIAMAPAM